MTKKERAAACIARLEEKYPGAQCSLEYQKAHELLISVRLAAQCTDARVNLVTPVLFGKFPTVQALAEAPVEDVEECIKSCGLYKTKARDIVACCKMLVDQYGGVVPDTIEELVKLPGIGRGYLRKARHCLRHPLHPHHQSSGAGGQQGPGKGGKPAAAHPPPGKIQRLLPPAGAFWPGGVHCPAAPVRGVPLSGPLPE